MKKQSKEDEDNKNVLVYSFIFDRLPVNFAIFVNHSLTVYEAYSIHHNLNLRFTFKANLILTYNHKFSFFFYLWSAELISMFGLFYEIIPYSNITFDSRTTGKVKPV